LSKQTDTKDLPMDAALQNAGLVAGERIRNGGDKDGMRSGTGAPCGMRRACSWPASQPRSGYPASALPDDGSGNDRAGDLTNFYCVDGVIWIVFISSM
jgi:hypothetical protein